MKENLTHDKAREIVFCINKIQIAQHEIETYENRLKGILRVGEIVEFLYAGHLYSVQRLSPQVNGKSEVKFRDPVPIVEIPVEEDN